MRYFYKQELPILNQTIRYSGIINSNFLDIIRYNLDNDDIGLNYYFEEIIKNSIQEKETYNQLTNVEKFLILINMRIKSMGDEIQMKASNGGNIKFSLTTISDNITKQLKNEFESKIIEENGIKIKFGIPTDFFIGGVDDFYKKTIHSIKIDNEDLLFSTLTDKEKEDIINLLPATISNNIIDYINYNISKTKDIFIIYENKNLGIQPFVLSFYDKSMFYFIKSILNEDLMNFYQLEYNIVTKMNISRTDFGLMTPNECKIYIKFYNEEMAKQEQSSKSHMPSMPSLPKR